MKTLFLDCGMGAAGDMLSAALLDLAPDPEAVVARLNAIGVPNVVYSLERTRRCGIVALRLVVSVGSAEECSHTHHHEHHHHAHRSLDDIMRIVGSLALPEKAKADVAEIYGLLAAAESRAHGRPVGEVHFHEVGALDAIADIAAACLLVSELSPHRIVASAVNLGGGTVRCAHGVMSVPAPATAFLLEGIPVHGDGDVHCELCTPTGAALLRHFADSFGPMPVMKAQKTGYGAGKRDFEERANLLAATIGESAEMDGEDTVCEFKCNIDDMTGEAMAFACERIFDAGAVDVLTVPVTMKKGRPGVVLVTLCAQGRRDAVIAAIFRHTSTIGVRETVCRRSVLVRREETATLSDGTALRRKVSEGYGVRREKVEFDDVATLARAKGVSLEEAMKLV